MINIQFRDAKPDDVEPAVPLLYSSGPEQIDYVLNTRTTSSFDFLTPAFISGVGAFGYKNFIVAILDEHIVGIGSFCSGSEFKRKSFSTGLQAIKFFGLKKSLPVLKRGKQVEALFTPPDKHTEFFTQIAVLANWRRNGIGTALLTRQIKIARNKQRQRCALDVAVTNPGAQKLYERLGFEVVWEKEWPVANSDITLPNHRRMELRL